jgi:hypothetical protein
MPFSLGTHSAFLTSWIAILAIALFSKSCSKNRFFSFSRVSAKVARFSPSRRPEMAEWVATGAFQARRSSAPRHAESSSFTPFFGTANAVIYIPKYTYLSVYLSCQYAFFRRRGVGAEAFGRPQRQPTRYALADRHSVSEVVSEGYVFWVA